MKRLKITLLYDNIYYIAFGFLMIVFIKYLFWILPFYLFYLRKKKFFPLMIIILGLFSARYCLKVYKPFPISNVIYGEVIAVKTNYTVKLKGQKVLLYTKEKLRVGDYIKAEGQYQKINYGTVPFDYNDYYLKKDIKYKFIANEISVLERRISRYSIRNYLLEWIDKTYSQTSSPYYKSLVLGDSSSLEIKDDLSIIGISHLFAISGLHILLIVKFLSLFLRERYINIFLVLYMFITGFAPSVMRASLIVILYSLFKKKEWAFSSLDVFSMVFCLLLFVNPFYLYDVGFELSFLATFGLLITEFRKKFQALQVSVLAQMITIPVVVNLTNQINLLTILYNLLIVGFFTTLFLPFTFISMLIPNLKIYEYLVIAFNNVIKFLSAIPSTISYPSFNPLTMLAYYASLFIFFNTKKWIYMVLIIMYVYCSNMFLLSDNLYILNVGQGDSTLINSPNGVVMIDCFNSSYKFLKQKGIREIDYLILTHGHDDHMHDAIEVSRNFKVHNLVVSYYDRTYLTRSVIPYFDKVIYAKSGDILKLGRIKMEVYAPWRHDENVNNISLVLGFNLGSRRYLFMGDCECEEELALRYREKLKCDVLKLGHHGSINALSKEFLQYTDPKIAVISVQEYNKYGLPSKPTLAMLENRKVHQTSIDNTYYDKYFFGILVD